MQKQKGFTLIELVVVIVILGVLAAVALPRFMNATEDAHSAAVKGTGGALAAACVEVWQGVLQGSAPSVAASGTSTDYTAAYAGTTCTYTYSLDGRSSGQRTIAYDTNTGVVAISAN